ncbi:MAG: peptidoglycan-binding domain-containing protein [Pseudomonadota bacterium]
MMKRSLKALCISAAVGCLIFTMPARPAHSQIACDDPNIADNLPSQCRSELISASGNQRPSMRWALQSARDHWQDEVLNKYGERYARWRRAACLKRECVPASLGGFTRCTLSGFPCITKPTVGQVTTLTPVEIREMQQLLNSAGIRPKIKVDGKFGPKSIASMERWQRRNNHPVDGLPSKKNLMLLRR